MPDIFGDLRRVGALKRDRLGRRPSDNALSKTPKVSRDTVGAWLRGERFPQRLAPLLAVVEKIRAEAAGQGILDAQADGVVGETVADLLAEDRWRKTWQAEQRRRTQANREAVERQQAQAALERQERRARQAALADRPRPLRSWTPQRLGVHPAIPGHAASQDSAGFVLPRYVSRAHDAELRTHLAAAVADGTAPLLVVVRGESCTGKTRTAFEALRAVVPGDFQLIFPADTPGLLAVLAANALGPRTVLWLNEAQTYLAAPEGEAVAAALLRRLDDEGPCIVVGTLWPDHDETLTTAPGPGMDDPHQHARALLAQSRRIYVPPSFAADLDSVRSEADRDRSLAAALDVGGVDLTQILAAGPDLVNHYEHPAGAHGAYGKALITVAMDAHRLGVTAALARAFLEAAAPGYLTDSERANADTDWFTSALAHAHALIKHTTRPLHDVPRPSGMGAQPGVVRLADYLQQYGRRTRQVLCPPASFWDAATEHLTGPTDLNHLADAARWRHRYRNAASLYCAAADAGHPEALWHLARMREEAGDREAAKRLDHQAANAGYAAALLDLARMREEAGDREDAERLAHRAADAGEPYAPWHLARMREEAGDREAAERLAHQAANAGYAHALGSLARWRAEAGDREDAERLYRAAADAGDRYALWKLALKRAEAGDWEVAERLAHRAANAGDEPAEYAPALGDLARMREEAGDALGALTQMREEAGDREAAERLAHQAASAGHTNALTALAEMRKEAGEREDAERLYRAAADAGDRYALGDLAWMLEEARDQEAIEHLCRTAPTKGPDILGKLAREWEEAGDREAAERLCRAAADAGYPHALWGLAQMRKEPQDAYQRYGLDPDGALARPWPWPEPRAAASDPP